MTAEDVASVSPITAIPEWMEHQTLKSVATPNYVPSDHALALSTIGRRLLEDRSIAAGKLSRALHEVVANPTMTRSALTDECFNGNSGYTMQLMWPMIAIFAGRMPKRVSTSTATGYIGWVNRIGRVVMPGLDAEQALSVHVVLDAVSEAFSDAVGNVGSDTADVAREAEDASDRVDTNEPGIYVFTTPTYLAYPPFGWSPDDPARQDFRYLKTGSTSVDTAGRIQSEIRRQTGLPEPYVILARFISPTPGSDYLALERAIHRILGEARHGPEDDGTRRGSGRGAGTEWFVTRLPLLIAIADSLGLFLMVSEDLKASLNGMFEECDLPDWVLP